MNSVSLPRGLAEGLRIAAGAREPWVEELHPKQRKFFDSKAKKRGACTGRRGGKSCGLATWHYEGLILKPGTRSVYITTTRAKAHEIMWDNGLLALKQRYKLPIRLGHEENQLMVFHENGSKLWLLGMPDQGEIDKVRGGKYFRASIDEAQAFPDWIEQLVSDSLEPALLDYDGDLAMTGSPGVDMAGYYYEVCAGQRPGWDVHDDWTALDNPYLPGAAAWINNKREELGEDNPTFQREYMGKWSQDPDALVYPFTRERNGWTPQSDITPYGLPEGEYSFGLGVDLGWSEKSTAFTLGAASRSSGKLYLLRSWARSRLMPTALGAVIQQAKDEVWNATRRSLKVVVDEGALGQGFTAQMAAMGVTTEPAQKNEKRSAQEFLKGMIYAGNVLVHYSQCSELIEECRRLPFDPETGKESDSYRKHNADSALYLSRALIPRYDPKQNEPKPGTTEWLELQAKKHKDETAKRLERARNHRR